MAIVSMYGFDNLKQKQFINQLYKKEFETSGVSSVEISAQDLESSSLAGWVIVGVDYSSVNVETGLATHTFIHPDYTVSNVQLKITIPIDSTKGTKAAVLIEKAIEI